MDRSGNQSHNDCCVVLLEAKEDRYEVVKYSIDLIQLVVVMMSIPTLSIKLPHF